MKRLYFYLSTLFCIFALGLSMSACSEEDELGANEGLSIKVYSPTKVIPGQEVVISGTGLDFATSVVFPGEVTTSDIEVINAGMIKVTTPAGIDANGGELVVNTETETATARVPMTIGNPKINIMNPSDKANVNDELTITGTDMEFFTKAYFPGEDGEEVVVNAIDFNRKSTSQLRLSVPRGIAEGMAAIRLETCDGKQYTLPEIELSATVPGYWETPEIVAWEGEFDLGSWSNNFEISSAWFEGIEIGSPVTLHFEVYNDWAQFKTNTGGWSPLIIPDWGSEIVTTNDLLAGATSLSFVWTEDLLNEFIAGDTWNTGTYIIINGEGVKFTKISYTKEVFIEGEGGGPTILVGWEGEQEVSWSDDAGKIPVPYSIFENVPVGAILNIEYNQIDQTWGCLQLNDASWTQIPFAELGGQGQLTPTDLYGWEFSSRCTSLVLTKDVLDQIHAKRDEVFGVDAGMVIQGQSVILTKVSVTYETAGSGASETVIWEGEFTIDGWNGNQDLAWGGYDWSTFASGTTISFYVDFVDPSAGWACISPRVGDNWGNLSVSQIDLVPSAEMQIVEWVPTDQDIADIQNKNGLVITGTGFIMKKITMK